MQPFRTRETSKQPGSFDVQVTLFIGGVPNGGGICLRAVPHTHACNSKGCLLALVANGLRDPEKCNNYVAFPHNGTPTLSLSLAYAYPNTNGVVYLKGKRLAIET